MKINLRMRRAILEDKDFWLKLERLWLQTIAVASSEVDKKEDAKKSERN